VGFIFGKSQYAETSASIFLRGLPLTEEFRDDRVSLASSPTFFVQVQWLNLNSQSEKTLRLLVDVSAMPTSSVTSTTAKKTVYIFSSSTPLLVRGIARFPRRLLSTKRRIGPGCIQRPPERRTRLDIGPQAQYQDEFYHCCHAYSNGSLITFPEFGTAKRRVDFYIPSRQ
jgi:hypothetical protein